jgi:glutathione S-transferase
MGSNSELKVLGARASPYVNRVQIALNLKSLDYEFIQENLQDKSELLLKSNPVHKKVPVFIHDEIRVCESLVIVEYIDEVWSSTAPSILPSHPFERANARFWAAYIDNKWFPSIRELRGAKDEESKKAAIEKVVEGIMLLEDVFVKSSKGKAFFGGEEIGYLDIVFGCFLGWLKVTEILGNVKLIDEVKTPKLAEWAAMFLLQKATKNVVPDPQELIDLVNKFQANQAAAASN